MSVYPATFGFSENSLTNRRGFNCIVAATFAAIAFITMFSASHFQVQYLGLFALVCVVVFVAIWLIFVLATRYVVKRWRQMSLHVGTDGLVRDSGTVRQTVSWDSITNVRFHHDPRGEPRTIEVFSANGPPLRLYGFESMSEVAALIKEHLPLTAKLDVIRQRLDRKNTVVIVCTIVLAGLVFEAIRRIAGETSLMSLVALMQIVLGIFFVTLGPLSRTNPNLRRWEIIMGALITIAGSVSLIVKAVELAR
jgi:predicted RND superfamily exporter protein